MKGCFSRRLLGFCLLYKDTTNAERIAFVKNIDDNKEYKSKVGEAILMIIHKMDDMAKPHIIGNLFKQSILGNIMYDQFLNASHVVNNTLSLHLDQLATNYSSEFSVLKSLDKQYLISLANSGVLSEQPKISFREQIRSHKLRGGSSKNLNFEKILNQSSEHGYKYDITQMGEIIMEFGYNLERKKWNS